MVPLAVVVAARAVDGAHAARVHAEPDPTGVVHVDLTVVVARLPGRAVAESDDLSAGGCRGLEPCFDGEGVRRLLSGGCTGVSAGERRGRVRIAGDGAGCAPCVVTAQRQRVGARPVVDGRSGRLAQPPVVGGTIVQNRVDVGRRGLTRDDDCDPRRLRHIARGVGRRHTISMGAARRETLIFHDLRRGLPERRAERALRDGSRRFGIAIHPVRQGVVVSVPVRLVREAHRAGRERDDRRIPVCPRQPRTLLVRRLRAHGEPHEPVLARAVDAREFATVDDVLVIRGNGPYCLRLTGERARRGLRVPVQELRTGRAGVVGVSVDVGGVDSAHVRRPRGRVVEAPWVGLREAPAVAAVVLVAGGVGDLSCDRDVVGVAVAVLDPHTRPVCPAPRERPLEVSARSVVPAHSVELRAIRGERHDARVLAGVADLAVDAQREADTGLAIGAVQTVTGVVAAADGGEVSGDHDLSSRGVGDDALHLPVVDGHRERQHRRSRGVQLGHPHPLRRPHGREVSADVNPVRGRVDRLTDVVQAHRSGKERAGRQIDHRETSAVLSVHLRERPGHVELGAVGRGHDLVDAVVERGRERGHQLTRGEVVGDDVAAGGEILPRCRSRRAHVGELARRVDGVSYDGLCPHHPVVELECGQCIGGHRVRQRRIGRRRRRRVRDRWNEHDRRDDRCPHSNRCKGATRHRSSRHYDSPSDSPR